MLSYIFIKYSHLQHPFYIDKIDSLKSIFFRANK